MEANPQGTDFFITRQTQKRHLATVWAEMAGLEPGMVVADIGCGPGILTCEYARIVGPTGVVYALENKAGYADRFEGLANVHFLFQSYEMEITLEQIPHIVFLTDKIQHVSQPETLLSRVFSVCGHSTKVLITGYDPTAEGRVGMRRHRRMAPARLIGLVEAAGFTHAGVIGAPDEHYALIAHR
jgi:2-polyprenyl-3-methyl-5-hydroxy-6-metoxy-1,4-benzoquinol methylase